MSSHDFGTKCNLRSGLRNLDEMGHWGYLVHSYLSSHCKSLYRDVA